MRTHHRPPPCLQAGLWQARAEPGGRRPGAEARPRPPPGPRPHAERACVTSQPAGSGSSRASLTCAMRWAEGGGAGLGRPGGQGRGGQCAEPGSGAQGRAGVLHVRAGAGPYPGSCGGPGRVVAPAPASAPETPDPGRAASPLRTRRPCPTGSCRRWGPPWSWGPWPGYPISRSLVADEEALPAELRGRMALHRKEGAGRGARGPSRCAVGRAVRPRLPRSASGRVTPGSLTVPVEPESGLNHSFALHPSLSLLFFPRRSVGGLWGPVFGAFHAQGVLAFARPGPT